MYYDLNKRDKKIARQLIEKGLQKEYVIGLEKSYSVIEKWKKHSVDNRESYMALYKQVSGYDRHIAKRYNGIGGSHYLMLVIELLSDGIITEADIEEFSEEVQNVIAAFTDKK